jgi:hypothetical protein
MVISASNETSTAGRLSAPKISAMPKRVSSSGTTIPKKPGQLPSTDPQMSRNNQALNIVSCTNWSSSTPLRVNAGALRQSERM